MIIDTFSGEYRWLSNFWPCTITYNGHEFPSVEHAYAFAKTEILEEQQLFLDNMPFSAKVAKQIGKEFTIRKDWQIIRLDLMLDFIRQKFNTPDLRQHLLNTGDTELIEGNTWHDTYWGVCDGIGENHLGRIIMKVRAELQA